MIRRLRLFERKKKSGIGADPRDQAEQPVDPDIAGHPRHLPFRHAEVARFPRHVGAERGGGGAAGERDEVEDHVEADGRLVPGMTNSRSSSCSIASTRWRTDAGRVPRPGKARRSSVGRRSLRPPRLELSARRPVSVWRAKRFPAKPCDAVRNQRPADRRGDRDEQLRPRRSGAPPAASRAARWAATGAVARRVEQRVGFRDRRSARRRSGSWRTNQAGEVDGATASISRSRPARPLPARSTLMPSAPQSAREPAEAGDRAPGPSGSAMRERRPLASRRTGARRPRRAAARRSAIGSPIQAGATGVGDAVEPGFEQGRARRQAGHVERGDQRVAVDRLAQQARAARARRAGRRRAPGQPEQAGDRVEAQRAARQLDAARRGQIGEGAAEHQVGLAGGESGDRLLGASAPLERDLLASAVLVVDAVDRRGSRRIAPSGARLLGDR